MRAADHLPQAPPAVRSCSQAQEHAIIKLYSCLIRPPWYLRKHLCKHSAPQSPPSTPPYPQVRFLARGFSVSGDHAGQTSHGLRWPYGPVTVISPFNFPLEIPALQLMGALFMGNRPLLHVDRRVSIVVDQLLRLMHHCGMPKVREAATYKT